MSMNFAVATGDAFMESMRMNAQLVWMIYDCWRLREWFVIEEGGFVGGDCYGGQFHDQIQQIDVDFLGVDPREKIADYVQVKGSLVSESCSSSARRGGGSYQP